MTQFSEPHQPGALQPIRHATFASAVTQPVSQ